MTDAERKAKQRKQEAEEAYNLYKMGVPIQSLFPNSGGHKA